MRPPGIPIRAAIRKGCIPWSGETDLKYTGPKPPFETLEGFEKYSFLKTPRWKDHAMEVGPLSRMIVGYAAGRSDVKEIVGSTLGKLNVPVDALFSTLGRIAARALDAELALGWLKEFFGELMDRVKSNDVSTFNGRALGAEELACGCGRGRPGRGPARRAGALDQDSRRHDRELSAGRTDDVEWFAAGCEWAALVV